ncbi:MAG: glycosyltransferase family 2 protein [Deltaproteobacteria bacterium]|nr:glycosyltransferase family 2 protein [Deltaproteobacteria bacterium]MBW2666389.1 glycosyltransferase family 2 protein [Deltaproteobacteria bacterium]
MNAGSTSFSLIVPAYNEAVRIGEPLVEMGAWLHAHCDRSEIIVVDDGSDDETCQVVRQTAPRLPVPLRLVRYQPNRGKGYALKVGFAAAAGDVLAFTDCDLSTSLDALPEFLGALERGADVAIGSRKILEATITRHQPILRETLGRIFTWIVRHVIADVSDATCGLKAFRRDAGVDLFAHSRIDDWSFDAEILRIARKRSYLITEIPVRWEDRDGTKVHLLRDGVSALIGIARILRNDRTGVYDQPLAIGPTTEESWGEPGLLTRRRSGEFR